MITTTTTTITKNNNEQAYDDENNFDFVERSKQSQENHAHGENWGSQIKVDRQMKVVMKRGKLKKYKKGPQNRRWCSQFFQTMCVLSHPWKAEEDLALIHFLTQSSHPIIQDRKPWERTNEIISRPISLVCSAGFP